MSQTAVEKALGKLITDECFRGRFFADPAAASFSAGLDLPPAGAKPTAQQPSRRGAIMTDPRRPQRRSTLGGFLQALPALVRGLLLPPRLTPVPAPGRRGGAAGPTRRRPRGRRPGGLGLALGLLLLAATPAGADPPALPAGVPNIYDPGVRAQFQPVGVVNLGGNADFPVLLLLRTSGEAPQALLFGLDARNGKATWSLGTDPIILILIVAAPASQIVYVDMGFAERGRASGAYAEVDDVNSPLLPHLLRAVPAAQPGTNI